jgi:hypothetical protein
MFELVAPYEPAGDQPQAIAKLTDAILSGAERQQGESKGFIPRTDGGVRRVPDNKCDSVPA